ncbi:MAG: baseplate J/gp47 family protein [Eubacterium sp.]|nr:baseplate J/gp47 family protein [Eubacterium sp.]
MALFTEYTEEELLERALEKAGQNGIDTRQGSVFYDAIAGIVQLIAELFATAEQIFEQSSVITASGENLDALAEQLYIGSLHREKAEKAVYNVTLVEMEGVSPDLVEVEDGDRFTVNGLYFELRIITDDDGNALSYRLEATEGGTEYNNVIPGTEAAPVETIDYLGSATVGTIIIPGVDEEEDEDFRKRIQEMLAAPTENANKQQYKTWCEEIDGVGIATIYPLFAGPNTVKAVLIDSNGQPCTADIVARVQNYVDPITRNTQVTVDGNTVTVGDGLGEGVAPIGAHFLAVSASNFNITVSVTDISIADGVDSADVLDEIKEKIADYFNTLTKASNGSAAIVVKLTKVSSLIIDVDGVNDFESVQLNNASANITVPAGQIPHLTDVELLSSSANEEQGNE